MVWNITKLYACTYVGVASVAITTPYLIDVITLRHNNIPVCQVMNFNALILLRESIKVENRNLHRKLHECIGKEVKSFKYHMRYLFI